MPNLGATELAIIAVIFMVIFGAGKLPSVMGDMAKGIKTFKKEIVAPDTDEE
jgi:sec-independent protein translocase protein TatA